jgi:hypothetical protein
LVKVIKELFFLREGVFCKEYAKKKCLILRNAQCGAGYVLNLVKGFVRMGKAVLPEP